MAPVKLKLETPLQRSADDHTQGVLLSLPGNRMPLYNVFKDSNRLAVNFGGDWTFATIFSGKAI